MRNKYQTLMAGSLFSLTLMMGAAAVAEAPELEDLMRISGAAYRVIDKGIAKGRWDSLADQAQIIADQALIVARECEPPMNREETDKFRALAAQLALDAQALKAELPRANATESKRLFKVMENTCTSCHRVFVPKKKKN